MRLEPLEDRCLPSADVVLEWNGIALDALKNDSLLSKPHQDNPGNASRALAIEQAAVFDAVNSIDRSYESYLIQVNAPRDASITTAAAQAAHDTLAVLSPNTGQPSTLVWPTICADPTPFSRASKVHWWATSSPTRSWQRGVRTVPM